LWSFGLLAIGSLLNPACACAGEDSANSSSIGKLANPQEILVPFEQGKERVRVIIGLSESPEAGEGAKWQSFETRPLLRAKIAKHQAAVLSSLRSHEFTVRHRYENFCGFSGEVTVDGLAKLLDNPLVASIEPDRLLYPLLAQGIPLINGTTYRSTYNGEGIAVAICDTGIDYTHPRLGGSGFPNNKVIGGYDCGDNDSDPMPYSGTDEDYAHGTCCAGIAAGDLGTVGDYVGGVAFNSKIYALKITRGSEESAWDSDVIAAWDWCITHQYDHPAYPIMIISNSFGRGQYSSSTAAEADNPSFANSARRVVDAGITILASSGNDGYCSAICAPAAFSSVISVGAVYDAAFGEYQPCVSLTSCVTKYLGGCPFYAIDHTAPDMVTSYSNTASFLNILAPSEQAYTTDIVGSAGYSTDDYDTSFGGTSAACPYAAGAVACLQQAAMHLAGRYLTPNQVRYKLVNTGDNITDGKVAITKPRINLARAMESFGGADRWEPDNLEPLANQIYTGSPQNHSIRPIGDIDWVTFSLDTESEVVIETSGSSGDTCMWLYDSALNLLEYDDDGGNGNFSRIDRLCGSDYLLPGAYYIKVTEYGNDDYIPNYDIHFNATPCAGPSHDPILSNGLVDPPSGYASTPFYWYVDYYDPDGDLPSTKLVYIDGSGYTMTLYSGSPSDGKYVYGPKSLGVGSHEYYFYFTDTTGALCRLPNSGTSSGPPVSPGGPVYFPDPKLKAAVEIALGISNPTPTDMLLLELLYASGGIVDITGLEYAKNIRFLYLGNNEIKDISAISGLTKLQELSIRCNSILSDSGFSPLAGLINLTFLDATCTANYIPFDMSVLAGLTNLTELDLNWNYISGITTLSVLTKLSYLSLEDNLISDIRPLSGLRNLRLLMLRWNPLNRAAYCIYIPLIYANNPGMEEFLADPDPDPSAECPVTFLDNNLKTVIEQQLGIYDPMRTDMLTLTNLNASSKGIANLAGLECATNLAQLDLRDNNIQDISPISGLANLTDLSLHGNQIVSIPNLSSMANLKVLNLGANPLISINGLSGLVNLTDLFLYDGQLSDILALSSLTNLEQLSLNHNQISTISALSGLTMFRDLDLHNNPLNLAAYATYLPLILVNNPGANVSYDPNPFDFRDFATFAWYWGETGCGICGGADLDAEGDVDLQDLVIFSENWLEGTE
jgi:Leucine-rich repeat (LRR) protein/subtilisin family serine protease